MLGTSESAALAQELFLRLLGAVYLVAFASLFVQIRGLYGRLGIRPAALFLESVRRLSGRARYWRFPSLFWFNCSNASLLLAAAAGMLCALLLFLGVCPPLQLALLWVLYLSFVTVGAEFLLYQWDALLLEVGFAAIFYALVTPPPELAVWFWWIFIFRFLFSAGTVKLTSGDPTWRGMRALCYHYQTQPLPNRLAWYAHQLPTGFQKFSVLATFFFELAVPFLFFGPPMMRLIGAALSLFFQLLIFATGNYGFFNILTMVLLVPLLDDRYLWPLAGLLHPGVSVADWLFPLVSGVFVCLIFLNLVQLLALFIRPLWVTRLLAFLEPWKITSPYGLFAVMTTTRYEFVIEGSRELREWQAYEFRYKPGDPRLAPRQVAPHQPRLDWQMWFAALRPQTIEPWLQSFLVRLLEGTPEVRALLRHDPFGEKPPEYLRLKVYLYLFASRAARRGKGVWWERELIGEYPPMSLPKSS